jgi:hypothetical protein
MYIHIYIYIYPIQKLDEELIEIRETVETFNDNENLIEVATDDVLYKNFKIESIEKMKTEIDKILKKEKKEKLQRINDVLSRNPFGKYVYIYIHFCV